ncbi:uncharacterized protein LOC107620669 [Arachis ipaensis]|uniref:uncharacterized protein LOC107620669 n=1 Tax=Arachis ipaensis TaxID=130454 RepID=UPI0007AEFADB|nr:uncharacterized protein LOC107620669 [Arachis ipaensis]XP_025685183.1 uncharacterized protein LOC112785976 [Arachis hypogaea]
MAARSRQAALDEIQGAYRKQYKRIADYCSELLRANPGSSVMLKVQRSPDFEVEDQHQGLNNYYIFQRLLTVIGWDPNDQMLPIAYAVVEAETKDTWKWFLQLLIDDFGAEVIGKTTFMSDQQKGLLPAFDEVILGVDHRFCVRHLYNNFRKKFPGLHLKQLMWRCAKATHWKEWEKEMQIIRQINVDAHRHLNTIPPRFWSRSRFNFHSKCDTLVNNMCESFDSAIVDSREKPIVSMLEDNRVYLMSRWALNRKRIKNFNGTVLPRIRLKLERKGRSAGEWRPYWSAAQTYEVVNVASPTCLGGDKSKGAQTVVNLDIRGEDERSHPWMPNNQGKLLAKGPEEEGSLHLSNLKPDLRLHPSLTCHLQVEV